jgi:hypothetical protein
MIPVGLYGCETWSLTIREHRLRVFENKVLRRIFGPKGDKWRETVDNCIVSISIVCTHHQILLRVIKSRRMRHVQRMGKMIYACKILVVKPNRR